ncbi:MAG: S41 family peptidase [Bacteroidales bacterium]|nr:S41 family peptidase [Bacteroidales bacterium]
MKKVLIAVGLVLLFLTRMAESQVHFEQAFKFGQMLEWLSEYYVDSVNEETMVEKAIIHLLKELDPHSSYLTKEEVKEMNEPLQGNFEGIGISFNILNDTIFVISPISGGPSERVGILAGDRIVRVDGENVAGTGITNNDVFSLLRGKKGTKVTVTVLRRNVDELLDFEIIRDKIPIFSVDASYKIKDEIGYIKVNRFSMTTMDEFRTALEKLLADDVTSLILDLTGNGGGYLEVAFELADEFLDDNKLIVYTEGLHSPKREYRSTSRGLFEKGNLIILIDEGSASASEIVAGAVQDWDRGIIIGRRSFGKGLVQKPFMMTDQSMIRLTIARYYTPTGRLIQKPYDLGKDDYDRDLLNRIHNGELMNKDSIHFPDSLKYKTLARSRIVYGGGGIMPDLFIPMDTTYYSDFYRDLIRKGILNQFVLAFVDNHRNELLDKYPSITEFRTEFEITDELFQELLDYSKNQNLMPEQEELSLSGNQIRSLMKAYIARDLWGTNEFYQILNEDDPKLMKSIQVLENWEKYQLLLQNNASGTSYQGPDENDPGLMNAVHVLEKRDTIQLC